MPAGSDATASITGTPEDPVLNLGIPKGADGSSTQLYMHELMFRNKVTRDYGACALLISAQQESFTINSLKDYLTMDQGLPASGYWYKDKNTQGTVIRVTNGVSLEINVIDPISHSLVNIPDEILDLIDNVSAKK